MSRADQSLMSSCLIAGAGLLLLAPSAAADEGRTPAFEQIVLSEQFLGEGATVADIDADGHTDVVSGPFWYAGPDYRKRHRYAVGESRSIAGYSSYFFCYPHDFNRDGHTDVLTIPMPGEAAYWHENPGPGAAKSNHEPWRRHLVLPEVSNESPAFADLTGDGRPELICIYRKTYGLASPTEDPTAAWRFTAVTEDRGYDRFTHGLGIGDVNGDGRKDLLEKDGWWEQPATGPPFKFHPYRFAQSGGAQMFAYDFDGDGDNDVLSVQNAHGWGLQWFEHRGTPDNIGFIPHQILPAQESSGLPANVSQMHAVALADMDGDGVHDIVTGKRFYAHGGKDPGAAQLPATYWFRTIREAGSVRFEPHLMHRRTGVGTQVTVSDIDADGDADVVVGNKLGTFLLRQTGRSAAAAELSKMQRMIGSTQYAEVVRSTPPLTPAAELQTFVLPTGFQAELVVAEPQIAKPMNLAFGTDGRLWVTSSREYPIAAAPESEGRDSIVVLSDEDGDGHRESVTTFADGLNIPIGLYPYRDGVICFSIPNIWFLRDTNGDGRADRREKLYGPFGYERDTHGMCNSFTRGLDGWLYACHGFNNHSTVTGADGHTVTMQSGNTFRMKLDGSRIEHYTHGLVNPFGMTMTPTGDLLVADCHTKPISLLLPGGYYDSFGKPHDGLGYVPDVMNHLHGSTAIGGIAQYNARRFPTVYHGNTFGGNVMTGRINRNSLQRRGSGFVAQEQPDLLIAGDPWFRPVDLQIGPDGALYVADFYNRIIGHYEVGLDHPGRDRQRGRIWKISYTDTDQRRDAVAAKASLIDWKPHRSPQSGFDQNSPSATPTARWIQQFSSENQTIRIAATEALTERSTPETAAALQRAANGPDETVRIHARWVLHRIEQLSEEILLSGLHSSSELERVHAFQVLAERSDPLPDHAGLLAAGLSDVSPLVRRMAAHAAAAHPEQQVVRPLLDALRQTDTTDRFLLHSLRMALRDHLQQPDTFRQATASLANEHVLLIADICLALEHPAAGRFIVDHLALLTDASRDQFQKWVQFAVRHVDSDSIGGLVRIVREEFRNDLELQRQLLLSAHEGLLQKGETAPAAVTDWGQDVALRLIGQPKAERLQQIGWSYQPHPKQQSSRSKTSSNPFVASTRRNASDGKSNVLLVSSFPKGERQTGIYRSEPFQLAGAFEFYMAGHDGFPDKPINRKNFVRLRDATSHQILQTWSPPRNDTAQPFTWSSDEPRTVYVEIVDGDSANAFAWLAAGRFSEPGLNPAEGLQSIRQGIALAGTLRLRTLRPLLHQLLLAGSQNRDLASHIAGQLAELDESGLRRAIAIAIGLSGLNMPERNVLIEHLTTGVEGHAALLEPAFKAATADEQSQLADALASDAAGIRQLVELIETGKAAATLLRRPIVQERLRAIGTPQMLEQSEAIVRELPPDVGDRKVVQKRIQKFLTSSADRSTDRGAELFRKNCSACHQVDGKGKKVGPNLDGIGNRGLARLVEDILAPSLNVDIAFRSSTIVTEDGKLYNGLSKGVDGERLILIDNRGQEISIPQDSIEEQLMSRQSPMPDNFKSALTEEQFLDLLSWLLTLRK